MGILKATVGAVHSVKEELWREFFYCDTMTDDTILLRGEKRVGKHSANTRKDDNMLTNGSILSVADGQCVLVVKQGKVIDFCQEPGEHVFEDPEQGGIKGFFREVGRRIAFGGGDIQPTVYRVYYMNTREITGLSFQTREAVPFRVRDESSGLDLDTALRLGGCFSYRVSDPVKLYRTVIGNVTGRFTREDLTAHMRASLLQGLQPALARLSGRGLRPYELPGRVPELCEALREQMNAGWCGEHGLELVSLALDSCVSADGELVQAAQEAVMLTDPAMAAAVLTQAAAEALPAAAANGS
jgi:membrane protease subunit (stomatin/prohibitin family)